MEVGQGLGTSGRGTPAFARICSKLVQARSLGSSGNRREVLGFAAAANAFCLQKAEASGLHLSGRFSISRCSTDIGIFIHPSEGPRRYVVDLLRLHCAI